MSLSAPPSKLFADRDALAAQIARWRADGLRIGFTNGAFDVLHVGHVRCLTEARALCDKLVLAVNSDRSVQANKGAGRPYMSQADRVEILAALVAVDAILIFEESTVDALLRALKPDLYAKGTDYRLDDLPERATVRELGIRFVRTGDDKTRGATAFIKRLREDG